jgi:membrane protein implicated in regulation of membrane protease activity
MAEQGSSTVGLVGLYDDPNALLRAAEMVRDAGYRRWDCHTPFPVHGLDRAMGLKSSPVPTIALAAGFVGLVAAIALTGGLSAWHYPIRIGGKPLFTWQAFVPIFFELFVLFAALAIMASLLFFCRLGRWHSPLHDSDIMKEVTGHRFAVVLDGADQKYSPKSARTLLEETGCRDIRPLVDLNEDEPLL